MKAQIQEVYHDRQRYFRRYLDFFVFRCLTNHLNKEKIANQRRNEAFNQEYDSFVNSLVRRLNEELWDSVTMIRDENVTTNSFFTVYNKYFQNA